MGLAAEHQGDARAAQGLPVPVHGGGLGLPRAPGAARAALRGLLALAAGATGAAAQAPAGRSDAPAYRASQLECSRWRESIRSDIETATGSAVDRARATRDGWWTLRARDTAGGVAVEAWYDSLAVTRRSAAGELTPDTDGLLGGRYRGLLGPAGDFTPSARPFVPDEVADVADLAGALDDFFQPLPSTRLAPGQAWRGPDIVLRRLPDSVAPSRPLARFAVESRRQVRHAVPRGDTLPVPVRQLVVEQGQFAWDRDDGLVRRTRDITVETTVPAGGRIRQAVRSRLVQHVELARLPASACP